MKQYSQFYRDHGIRFMSQMTKPIINPIEKLALPMGSVLHFVDTDAEAVGITPEEPIISNNLSAVIVDHVINLSIRAKNGNPVSMQFQPGNILAEYHRKYRQLKIARNMQMSLRAERTLLVTNYNLINWHYRYIDHWKTPYNKWANMYQTIWEHIQDQIRLNNRQHYIQMHLPPVLPPLSVLRQIKDRNSRSILERFKTDADMFLFDIWQWIGEERHFSTLKDLTREELKRINLIWIFGGKWACLNLGMLDIWRKVKSKDKAEDENLNTSSTLLDPEVLQKHFLRLLMALQESSTLGVTEEEVKAAEEEPPLPPLEEGPAKDFNFDEEPVEEPVVDEKRVDADLAELEKIDKQNFLDEQAGYSPYTPPPSSLEENITKIAEDYGRRGLLSAAEVRRMATIAKRYKDIPNPFNGKGKLADLTQFDEDEIKVEEQSPIVDSITGVVDNSMLSCSLKHFDERYIRKVLPKDIVSMVMNLQKAGVAIENYTVQPFDDLNDSFDVHTVKLAPVVGKPSTISFRVPRIEEDGTFKAAGTQYRMRKQRGDLPIRKTAPDKVALTSYYSKMFVTRSERAVFNYPNWLVNQIVSKGIDETDLSVVDLRFSDVFRNEYDIPRAMSIIGTRVSSFVSGEYTFYFDYHNREKIFGQHTVSTVESIKNKDGSPRFFPVGTGVDKVLVMDVNDDVYSIDRTGSVEGLVRLGCIEEIIGLPLEKRPVEMADIGIFGEQIPIGFVLAQHIGLGRLIKTLGTKVRREKIGAKYELQPNEYVIRFEDEALIFDRGDRVATLIFNGFNRYHREIKRFSVYAFDKKEVYANVLSDNGIGARHVREFDMMHRLWVDHITAGILVEMKEPTDLFNLMISAVRKLTTDYHPDQMDNAFMRDKGYERVAGMIYFELIKAMRGHAMKPVSANSAVSLNPEAVWMAITRDQSVINIKESNPVHFLKEQEVVIFSGAGGRTGRSMTAGSREYHPNGMGVVSEATVDSGDVATITYLTADPNYTTLRGTTRRIKETKGKAAKLVSTSMMLAPGADRDDPKRVNFISIQNSATTHTENYTPLVCRTGYERVMIHRMGDLYGKTALEDGEVVSVKDGILTVKYKDDSVAAYQIGRRFGKWDGEIVPQDIATRLKTGDTFKKNDVLFYNSRYFTPDSLDPSQVLFKFGMMARVAMIETTETLEDSCAISKDLAKRLVTMSTHIRHIKVTYDQEIRNLIKVGEKVESESILCTIHASSSGNSEIFSDESLQTLSLLGTNTPKAKMIGTVDKVDVIYTGDIEEMSDSIRSLTEKSDQELRRNSKALGRRIPDGRVERGFRVDGQPLGPNTAVIRVYITGPVEMGIGDKLVFGNQMKSIVGGVMVGENTDETGEPIDAKFSYQSLSNRIVNSPELIGTTATLSIAIGKLALEAYFGE